MAHGYEKAPERRELMALKAILLRKEIESNKAKLAALREKTTEFETREAEIEAAIDEAETEEEKTAISEEVGKFEAEKEAHDKEVSELENTIAQQERELEEIERKKPEPQPPQKGEKRDMNVTVNIRSLPMNMRAFDALPMEQRRQIVESDEVRSFLSEIRTMGREKRAIQGAELTIPVFFLDLISENMYRYSKLINRVRVRNVGGEARQTIAGTVPEAVWTEMCGAINELTFVFNRVTLDGFKVAGFIPVCNSLLEDSDINLASAIVEMLSEAIGLAKDKAILYGKGAASKMPLGIVTRLAQTAAPSDYPANAPAWVDLHTSNIIKIDDELTGAAFWAALMQATGNTYTNYSRGTQFWAMNSKTYSLLKSKVITFTANGDIAANIFGTLPIINGDIDILEFIPDGDIIGGYGDLYLWAQRGGMTIESSTEVQFIQDNTVFKGKERADGQPVIPGAFVAININGNKVTTAMTFAADKANDAKLQDMAISGLTLAPTFDPDTQAYTTTATGTNGKVEVTAAQADAEIAIEYNGKNVRNGGTITFATGTFPLTVTVTKGNAVRVYSVAITKAGE
jgi:HK97 family phage major capsid protein